MPFESLSYRYKFELRDFPERWLPLISLYDPDLPLFPIYYFHIINPDLQERERPSDADRAFGYVEKVNLITSNTTEVTIVTNKNLELTQNRNYRVSVESEVRERFGLNDPVVMQDVASTFTGPLAYANNVLSEIWQRVVTNAYGNKLPFGRLWDPVLGITRFVSSWNPPQGRKSEIIQTHYFTSKFGVRIQSSGDVPQIDFYLLPSIDELRDSNNPLSSFPSYSRLSSVASSFHDSYCSIVRVEELEFSKFTNPYGGIFNTEKINRIFNSDFVPSNHRKDAIECFNAFDKGPARTVIFLMMLDDIRHGRLNPDTLTSSQCGSIYDSLKGTYQSPKAIQIYAQQSFGNPHAMPSDTWVQTFFKWPLKIWPQSRGRNKYRELFSNSRNLGKTERLIWVSAQARKVHSSACNDILWCIKYGSKKKIIRGSEKKSRGANPLACKICQEVIRRCCPAYQAIRTNVVCFNQREGGASFTVKTSSGNNTTTGQKFLSCEGNSIYEAIQDDFSPADNPSGLASFPASHHQGNPITVEEFIRLY